MSEQFHPPPELDTGGNIAYIPFENNQTNITNLNYVEWSNILTKPTFGAVAFNSEYDSLSNVPFKRNATDDIIYRGHNVGIGLQEGQSPINKLHLIGDLFITENFDTWDFLRFYHNADTAFLDFGGVENGVSFRMNTGTTSYQDNPTMYEVMRFRNNKIGILTNDPQYSLDINGSLNATNIYGNGSNITGLNYDNIPNRPNLALKQDTLSNTTLLYGNGLNISNLDYNNITNKPNNQWITSGSNIYYNAGNVGISNINPIGTLTLGNSSVANSDGSLIIAKNSGAGSRHFKLGIDNSFNFVIGDAGNNNVLGTWNKQFAINYGCPVNTFIINEYGDIGIGTNNPYYKLDINGNLKASTINADGSNISNLDYNKIPNRPDLSTYITTSNANLLNTRFFNNNGNLHGALTDFNNISQFGYNFILGNTNGPGVNGAGNYYSWDIGLGSEYGFNYSAQFALPRDRSNPYLCVRYKNNNVYGGWTKLSSAYADSVDYVNIIGKPDLTLKQDVLSNASVLLGNGSNISNLDYNKIPNRPNLSGYATTASLALKQDTLSNTTLLLGNGSNISNLNYSNIPNRPDLSGYLTTASLASKQDILSNTTLLLGNGSNISNLNYSNIPNRPDLSGYLTTATASSTYATITNLNAKENALIFSSPLTRTTNTISLDLSSYDTIALRNTALSSYLTTATASSTYATITNLNAKENALIFSSPLTRTTNTISLDLSSYDTIALRNTALSSYLTTATASSTYATITNLNAKENALTFSSPLIRTTNTISLDTSTYITTTNANLLNNRFFNNNGNNHGGTLTNFNSVSQYGFNYVISAISGIPSTNNQFYTLDIGIGAEYGFGSANGTYRAQLAIPRNTNSPYIAIRHQENNTFGGWSKVSAGYADSAGELSAGTKLIQGGLNLTATNPAVYFQGGDASLGYASTGGAYSGSANAGDLVLRSSANQALILQSGSGGFALAVNTNNTVSFSGQILLPGSWRFIIGTYGGVANTLGLVNANNNAVWYFRGNSGAGSWDISDERTKRNIEDIDNSLDLLNQLKPKKYIKLVDRDEINEYGLIAQDVKNVIPEIVYNEPYYTPDIYEDCEYNNETKTFISTKDQSLILKVGTKIKIVLDKKDGENDINNLNSKWCYVETEIIEVIDEFTFKFKDDVDINEDFIFIYGTFKEDFKTLDYKSLHAINIKATQELYKIIQNQEERLKYLEDTIKILIK